MQNLTWNQTLHSTLGTPNSHRHFKHPTKPGLVTIAGQSGVDIPKGTMNSILKQSGLKD